MIFSYIWKRSRNATRITVLAEALDSRLEIEEYGKARFVHPEAGVAPLFGSTRSDVARPRGSRTRDSGARGSSRGPPARMSEGFIFLARMASTSSFFLGTQIRPSLRSDSDIRSVYSAAYREPVYMWGVSA